MVKAGDIDFLFLKVYPAIKEFVNIFPTVMLFSTHFMPPINYWIFFIYLYTSEQEG